MHNKGQVSSGFNYIFAIIIGGIVFMFLIAFAYQYISFSGSLSAAELVSSLNDEFAAFASSDSAEKVLSFSQSVDFSVYQGSLSSKGQSRKINQAIFSPVHVQGNDISLATRSIELPYRVANAFYVTDKRTVYVLVYDSSTKDVVDALASSYDSIPSNFATQTVSITQLSSNMQGLKDIISGYDSVRFIFFSSSKAIDENIAANFNSYEILEIDSTVEDYSYGTVHFPEGKSSIYLGYPLLIGAMVSADADSYDYSLNLVLDDLKRVTNTYYNKAKFLSTRLPECDYGAMKTALNNYIALAGDTSSFALYQSKIEIVDSANKALGGDCPEIF